ncbi:phage virion morphogenesis protein [Rhizobium sp. 9140]|uniref:phage virion morphogenesis protein n=1 Tax=Rhizobium sp. 9140 TaxID=1761900 RepID=UPI00079BA95D|nr:phage virion morphogenesis protein [Rhizobium sp. 9140]CZT36369.1 phage virion morphogenesis (putative tail completion) protein [Rhizobium sp. 9140]
MTAATITIDDASINDALARLLAAAGNIKPVLKNIGEFEAKVTRRRFIDQKDPNGAPWVALNPLYAKTKKGPGILRGETRSLSQIVWQLAGDGVEIGSNEVYARIHNEGGTIRPKTAEALVFSMGGQTFKVQSVKIPKRQFLGFNEASITAILDIVKDHFVDAIEQK